MAARRSVFAGSLHRFTINVHYRSLNVLSTGVKSYTHHSNIFEYMRNLYESITWDDIIPLMVGLIGGVLLMRVIKFCFRAFKDAVAVRSPIVKRLHVLTSMATDPLFGPLCKTYVARDPSAINVPLGSYGYTPFLRACWCGAADVIRFMLEKGADVTRTTTEGETGLHLAAYHISKLKYFWDPTCLELLIRAGCSVNATTKEGNTALHFAAKQGHARLIHFLLIHGADPEIPNKLGFKPYQVAEARLKVVGGKDYAEAIRILTLCVCEMDNAKVLKLNWKKDSVLLAMDK